MPIQLLPTLVLHIRIGTNHHTNTNTDHITNTSTSTKTDTSYSHKYAKDNAIHLILNKKNVIIGKSDLDITQNIMKSLNNKIKDIKLKN